MGRTYEGFGKTLNFQAMMAGAAVKGYQGETLELLTISLAVQQH